MRIYQCISQIGFLKLEIGCFYIKDVYLSNHCSSIFWLLYYRSLENYSNLSDCIPKKAYITIIDRVGEGYIRFYHYAESDMIIPMIIPMNTCCF